MKYYIRTVKSKRFFYKRGKEAGFQDGVKGARTYRSYDTAGRACQEIEVKSGIRCEYIDEFEIEKETNHDQSRRNQTKTKAGPEAPQA